MGSAHTAGGPCAQEQPAVQSPMQALSTGLRRRPLLACVVCFLLGIAIADLQPSGWLLPGCLCMAAVIGTLLMLRRTPSPGRFSPAAPGEAATLAALLFLGMFLHAARLSVPRDDISRLTGAKSWIVDGTVVTVPETRWERQVFRVRVAAARVERFFVSMP